MIYKASGWLVPYRVRMKRFGTRWRGLDPAEVYAYLRELADELARLEREVTTSRTETERLRQGLRQWRARHVGCRFTDPVWPPRAEPSARPSNVPSHELPEKSRNNRGRW